MGLCSFGPYQVLRPGASPRWAFGILEGLPGSTLPLTALGARPGAGMEVWVPGRTSLTTRTRQGSGPSTELELWEPPGSLECRVSDPFPACRWGN